MKALANQPGPFTDGFGSESAAGLAGLVGECGGFGSGWQTGTVSGAACDQIRLWSGGQTDLAPCDLPALSLVPSVFFLALVFEDIVVISC